MTASSNNNISLSWREISNDSKALALKVVDKGQWIGVIAVTTGGMVPACIVARHLGLKNIQTFSISSYDDQSQRAAQIIHQPTDCGDGAGWLVVDDLSDKGNTLRIIREYLPKAHYATLYTKPEGESAVDTYISGYSQATWLHFPWEDNEKSYIPPAANI